MLKTVYPTKTPFCWGYNYNIEMVCFLEFSAVWTGTFMHDVYTNDRYHRLCFPTIILSCFHGFTTNYICCKTINFVRNNSYKDVKTLSQPLQHEPRHEKTSLWEILKPACSAQKLAIILDISYIGILLSRCRITKVLIRLRGCAGWSAPLLFAFGIFSRLGTYTKGHRSPWSQDFGDM